MCRKFSALKCSGVETKKEEYTWSYNIYRYKIIPSTKKSKYPLISSEYGNNFDWWQLERHLNNVDIQTPIKKLINEDKFPMKTEMIIDDELYVYEIFHHRINA